MKSKPAQQVKDSKTEKPILIEKGIIQPFKKRGVYNDRCGINREKNLCGDASEY